MSAPSRSYIDVVEAGYQVEPSDEAWLSGVLDIAGPLLDQDTGMGVAAYRYEVTPGQMPRLWALVGHRTPEGWKESLLGVLAYGAAESSIEPMRNGFVGNVSDAMAGITSSPMFSEYLHRFGCHDVFMVAVHDPDMSGLAIAVPQPKVASTDPRKAMLWRRIGAHLLAGLRLRPKLMPLAGETTAPAAEQPSRTAAPVEAVLTPDGTVVHAEGDAEPKTARAALREAVKAMEQARGPLRKRDPATALRIWQALVEGRWSLLDQFDSDGRRFLIARQNEPRSSGPSALSHREQQVVAYACMGHSNKLIAYELGISPSTVGVHLTQAARKLGVRSRAALIQLFANLACGGPAASR